MLSLLRFGERAGSGLKGILHVWEKVYHTDACIKEKSGVVDRTILSLPLNGHEQDVEAMLQFYDDPEELVFGASDVNVATLETTNSATFGTNDATSAANVATFDVNSATSAHKRRLSRNELKILITEISHDWVSIYEIVEKTQKSNSYLRNNVIPDMLSHNE